MAILPKDIYRFHAILIKSPSTYFTEIEPMIIKFAWKHAGPRIAKAILRTKSKAAIIILPDCTQHYGATILKQGGPGTETDLWDSGKEQRP